MPCLPSSSTRKFLTNPSSLRISARRTLSLEEGMSTFSCSARLALRTRVSMSPTGSLYMGLPARFHDARHLALEGQLPETQAAELKLPEIAARAPAQLAAVMGARHELRRARRPDHERDLGHDPTTP